MRAVADDLAATGEVGDVRVGLDPVGDLGLDGRGEHLSGSSTKDLAENVTALSQWHDADVGGRLAHGGVLLCLVGTSGVGETSPRVRRPSFQLHPRNSTIPRPGSPRLSGWGHSLAVAQR
jgi:hypothetical protein